MRGGEEMVERPSRPRPANAREWARALLFAVGLLCLYFVAPLGHDDDPLPLPVALALSVAITVGLAVLIGRRILQVLDGTGSPAATGSTGLPSLLSVLVLVVVAFASGVLRPEPFRPGSGRRAEHPAGRPLLHPHHPGHRRVRRHLPRGAGGPRDRVPAVRLQRGLRGGSGPGDALPGADPTGPGPMSEPTRVPTSSPSDETSSASGRSPGDRASVTCCGCWPPGWPRRSLSA